MVDDDLKMFLGFGKESSYKVYPSTSINSLETIKFIKIFIKYLIYKLLRYFYSLLPHKIKMKIKMILKKYK